MECRFRTIPHQTGSRHAIVAHVAQVRADNTFHSGLAPLGGQQTVINGCLRHCPQLSRSAQIPQRLFCWARFLPRVGKHGHIKSSASRLGNIGCAETLRPAHAAHIRSPCQMHALGISPERKKYKRHRTESPPGTTPAVRENPNQRNGIRLGQARTERGTVRGQGVTLPVPNAVPSIG